MKLAIIGATGNIGGKILAEALSRGHDVTAIVRSPDKLLSHPRLTPKKGDVADDAALSALLKDHDAVISSIHFSAFDGAKLVGAVRQSGVRRYLAVGGAGSLEVQPGVQLVDTPQFPAEYKTEAGKGRDYLNFLKQQNDLDWTFLSPAAVIAPGTRTGTFRLGKDAVLFDKDGNSSISQEDYAIAMLDEVEKPQHVKQRFTVGY